MPVLIESLYLYPVKSCAAVPVSRFRCTEKGPEWDREWMIVGGDGKFVTQREVPELALIRPAVLQPEGWLRLTHPSRREGLLVPIAGPRGAELDVEIFGQAARGTDEGKAAADWLSDVIGQPLRLVRATKEGRHRSGDDPRTVRFADSYPLHLCALPSLDDLNARAGTALEILRFRPNVVVSGTEPWGEDHWPSFRAEGELFRNGKRCERCPITTVDPLTGRRAGAEPLKTLAGFRRNARNKVEFGQYFHTPAGSELRVGQEIVPG